VFESSQERGDLHSHRRERRDVEPNPAAITGDLEVKESATLSLPFDQIFGY